MARKKKELTQEVQEVMTSNKSYQIVKALNGSINNKVYSFKEGDIVEFSRLEAILFSSYVKEQ